MQVRRFLLSQAVALVLAGVPAVYIHSLLGSRNWAEGVRETGHNRTINRAHLRLGDVEAALADKTTFRAKVFAGYTQLIRRRRTCTAFHPNAAQEALDVDAPAIFALLRTAPETGEQVLALHNLAATPQELDLPHGWSQGTVRDLLSEKHFNGRVVLDAYEVLWLTQ